MAHSLQVIQEARSREVVVRRLRESGTSRRRSAAVRLSCLIATVVLISAARLIPETRHSAPAAADSLFMRRAVAEGS